MKNKILVNKIKCLFFRHKPDFNQYIDNAIVGKEKDGCVCKRCGALLSQNVIEHYYTPDLIHETVGRLMTELNKNK